MVVALRALHRQPEEDRADGRCHFIQRQLPALQRDGGLKARSEPQKPQRDAGFRRPRRELVAGQLLLHEAVVRLVIAERLDRVVAITPHGVVLAIGFESLGVGVARQVEPMPAPTLAIARIAEQPVDQLRVGVR